MFALFAFSLLLTTAFSDKWAVLVAGSKDYVNYRHQANVCHAFQILRTMGIPDDHIIVMMADDIANNPENPVPGNIINSPGGPNVYAGVNRDYTGTDVTPENFLNVLRGNRTDGTPKVLMSNQDDSVFIYYADHGAPGLVAFPYGGVLYSYQLIDTLRYMHDNGRFGRMLIYVEACESGSMFDGLLPPEWNVYAVTASTPFESSYACYCDSDRGTCLSDVFSANWLENSEPRLVEVETLYDQFLISKLETTTSQVCVYGNLSMGRLFLDEFLGGSIKQDQVQSQVQSPFDARAAIRSALELDRNRFPGRSLDARSALQLARVRSSELTAVDSRTWPFAYWSKRNSSRYEELVRRFLLEIEYFGSRFEFGEPERKGCHDVKVVDSRCIERHLRRMTDEIGPISEAGLELVSVYLSPVCTGASASTGAGTGADSPINSPSTLA